MAAVHGVKWTFAGAAACVLALAGCGGGGGADSAAIPTGTAAPATSSSSSAAAATAQNLGGIWIATNPLDGSPVVAVADESANFDIAFSDSLYYGTAGVIGDQITTMQLRAVQYTPGASRKAYWGNIGGKVASRQSLELWTNLPFVQIITDWSPRPLGNTDLRFQFSPQYLVGSSLALIAGTYRDRLASPTVTLTIGTDGVITGSYEGTDKDGHRATCRVSGKVALINPSYNLYAVSQTASCPAPVDQDGTPQLDGVGMAYVDFSRSPTVLHLFLHTDLVSMASGYGLGLNLVRE